MSLGGGQLEGGAIPESLYESRKVSRPTSAMKKMLKAIRGVSPQRKCAEEDMRMESLMVGGTVFEGTVVDATAGTPAGDAVSPLAHPNTFDPAMAESDRPRGTFKSGSFDLAMLPKVSLSFLNEDRTNAQLNATPTINNHKTPPTLSLSGGGEGGRLPKPPLREGERPPMSPLRQAAIEKCIAAIEECKAALAEDPFSAASQAQSVIPLACQAQGASPLAGGASRSPLAGGARVFRKSPYIRRGDVADAHYSEEAVWAWLEGATDKRGGGGLPPPDAFGRLGAPPPADMYPWTRPARHGRGEEEDGRDVVEPVVCKDSPRVYRTTPYVKRGVAPDV